jgi:hypothetical protein
MGSNPRDSPVGRYASGPLILISRSTLFLLTFHSTFTFPFLHLFTSFSSFSKTTSEG